MSSTYESAAGAAGAPPGRERARAGAARAEALSLGELIALVAGPRADVAAISDLAAVDLPELARRSPRDLRVRAGLPPRAAQRLAAAFELGRRVERAVPPHWQINQSPHKFNGGFLFVSD